jgi:hypothetical protein
MPGTPSIIYNNQTQPTDTVGLYPNMVARQRFPKTFYVIRLSCCQLHASFISLAPFCDVSFFQSTQNARFDEWILLMVFLFPRELCPILYYLTFTENI